jgi:hypothetical protein
VAREAGQNKGMAVVSVPDGPRRRAAVSVLGAVLALAVASTVAGAVSLGPSNQQRRAMASVEARHLLTLVRLPPGSTALARWNRADGHGLTGPAVAPAEPDKVVQTRYFLAPNGRAALDWVELRVPRGATVSGTGTGSGPGVATISSITFGFRAPSPLLQPELEYSMLITPHGQLGLRVDAIVTWTPRKSPFSIVATGAARVVVRVDRGPNVTSGRVTVRSVSDGRTIRSFISRINRLPVALPGVSFCPLDVGATMTLSFFRDGSPRPYAVVEADPAGCGSVAVSQYGAGGALLGVGHDSEGQSLATFVATALSITNWTGMAGLH